MNAFDYADQFLKFLKNFTLMKTLILITIFSLTSFLTFSQDVASLSGGEEYVDIPLKTVNCKLLKAETNIAFSNANYSSEKNKLTLDAEEFITSITVKKDDKIYLANMPVFSSKLRLSTEDYESGEYEILLYAKGKAIPTVIVMNK